MARTPTRPPPENTERTALTASPQPEHFYRGRIPDLTSAHLRGRRPTSRTRLLLAGRYRAAGGNVASERISTSSSRRAAQNAPYRTSSSTFTTRTQIGTSGADGGAGYSSEAVCACRGQGRYERRVASLYCCSTSLGMRPRAGIVILCSVAQARITLGSRFALVERDDVVWLGRRRRLDCRSPVTGRQRSSICSGLWTATPDSASTDRFRASPPFHPSRTVSAPSDPSRSSTNTSTVTFAIACLSIPRRRYLKRPPP